MKSSLMNEKKLVEVIISQIKSAGSLGDLEEILADNYPEKYKKDKDKYPTLPFSISEAEIDTLKDAGWIDGDNQLVVEKFDAASTLEKLLFSLIWKNGDLRKISNIIDGIQSKEVIPSDRITFYEFGRFLKNPKTEVIVDQHVIRAYRYMKAIEEEPSSDELSKIKKLSNLFGKHEEIVQQYKIWLRENDWVKQEIKEDPLYLGIMDDILFALGKKLKA